MKTINMYKSMALVFALLFIAPLTQAIDPIVITGQSVRRSIQIGDGGTISIKDGFSSYDLKFKGDITLNDDDRTIKSISPNGYLKFSVTTFGNKRSLLIEANSSGQLRYEYYEGRKQVPYEPEGKAWLADVLIDIARLSGIDAEGRAIRIYSKGGIHAFETEMEAIPSNSIQRIYYETLLNSDYLKTEDLDNIAQLVSHTMTSNTEQGNIYRKHARLFNQTDHVAESYYQGISRMTSNTECARALREANLYVNLQNKNVVSAYFDAINRMTSNTERGHVLRHLIRNRELNDYTYIMLFMSIDRMTSNTEMRSVFNEINQLDLTNSALINEFFNAIEHMTSNTEAGAVMRHALRHHKLSIEAYKKLIDVNSQLTSNTEMGNVLDELIEVMPANDDLTIGFFTALQSFTSNTELGNVLRKYIRERDLSVNEMAAILKCYDYLTSNTELGSVMRDLAPKLPRDNQKLRELYLNAANSLTSNTEYRNVMDAYHNID